MNTTRDLRLMLFHPSRLSVIIACCLIFLIIFYLILEHPSKLEESKNYGRFPVDPIVRLLGDREFELLFNFDYVDPEGRTWRASAPFKSDGASIPRIFGPIWAVLGKGTSGMQLLFMITFVTRGILTGRLCTRTSITECLQKGFLRRKLGLCIGRCTSLDQGGEEILYL